MAAQPPHISTVPAPFSIPPLGTVLITGGCGFLGSHIVQLILSRNYSAINTQVHVVDLREPTESQPGALYHTANLTSSSDVAALFDRIKPEVVIHTASPVFTSIRAKDAAKTRALMYKVNVEGTRALIEESKRFGVKAFIYTSSASVISDNTTDLINADEQYTPIRGKLQTEYYSDTKAQAEELALAANSRTSSRPFLTTALRPASMFGERDVQFIPPLLKVVRDGRTGFQLGDNDNLFDVTYVGNVAQAHIQAAIRLLDLSKKLQQDLVSKTTEDEDDDSKVDGEAFMITNQSPVYFWDFTRSVWHSYYRLSVASAAGTHLKPPATSLQAYVLPKEFALFIATVITFIMGVLGLGKPSLEPQKVRFSCMTRYYKSRKAEAALGYMPEVPLDEAVERTVKWFVDREARGEPVVEAKKDR